MSDLRHSRLGHLAAAAIVVAAAVSGLPSRGAAKSPGDAHCGSSVRHDMAAAAHTHHAPARGDTQAPAQGDGCSHCPVTACVVVSPCSGEVVALATTSDAGAIRSDHAGPSILSWRPARSLTQQPPTPPPHTLL